MQECGGETERGSGPGGEAGTAGGPGGPRTRSQRGAIRRHGLGHGGRGRRGQGDTVRTDLPRVPHVKTPCEVSSIRVHEPEVVAVTSSLPGGHESDADVRRRTGGGILHIYIYIYIYSPSPTRPRRTGSQLGSVNEREKRPGQQPKTLTTIFGAPHVGEGVSAATCCVVRSGLLYDECACGDTQ